MNAHLKIKIKSLAAEARIIRDEELRLKKRKGERARHARQSLWMHRTNDVRRESRSAGLAYGFLRNRSYEQMEKKTRSAPDWKRVEQLILKYGDGDSRDLKQRFAEWSETKSA